MMGRLGIWREATVLQACCLTAPWAVGSCSPHYLHSQVWTWKNKVKLRGVLLQASDGGGSNCGPCGSSAFNFFLYDNITNNKKDYNHNTLKYTSHYLMFTERLTGSLGK